MAINVIVGIVIGLGAGVLAGLFGIGGGIVIVPTLVLLGLTQKQATGTSLAALLMPVAVLGVLEYARRGEIRFPYAVGIALGLVGGALVGARLAGTLSNVALQRAFGGFLLIVGAYLAFFKR
jgi:uncharacterized protein